MSSRRAAPHEKDPTLAFLHQRIGRLTARLERGTKLTEDEWDELVTCRKEVIRIHGAYYPNPDGRRGLAWADDLL